VFGVPSGKLLGFIVSSRGIEAYPTKINAIRFMKPPRCKKDLMKLTGCMAALSQFISRLGDKGLPFFKLLRKSDKFEWNKEAVVAFQLHPSSHLQKMGRSYSSTLRHLPM